MKNKTVKRVLIVSGAVIFLALIIYASIGVRARGGAVVYAQKAEQRDIIAIVTSSGEVRPKTEVKISSKVMGEVRRITAEEGERVKKGALLIELDARKLEQEARRLRALLDAARAQVKADSAVLKNAEDNLERNKELFTQGFISQSMLDAFGLERKTAEMRLASSEARIREAEAALSYIEEELRDMRFFAPIDGIVTRINIEEGENVVMGTMNIPGTVLLEMADLSEMIVKVNVDETQIVKISLGQSATIAVDAVEDFEYRGKVIKVGSSADVKFDGVNTFPVEVKFENPDERLKPGMSADVDIETGKKENVIAIPISSVITRGGRKIVYAIVKERAAERFVVTGISDDTHVEISDGVAEGETVATGPYRALQVLENKERVKIKTFEVKTE